MPTPPATTAPPEPAAPSAPPVTPPAAAAPLGAKPPPRVSKPSAAAAPAPSPAAPPAEPAPPDPAPSERVRRLIAKSAAIPSPSTPAEPVVAPAPAARAAPTPAARGAPAAPAGEAGPPPLTSIIKIAERSGRTDLASKLKDSEQQLRFTGVTVAIVGEFKKGKSSLVNALVNAEVCPSDPVFATVTPIAVRHGPELAVSVSRRRGQESVPADLGDVATLASEEGNEGNHLGVTGVEITVPRRVLATGLCFVDTPGVGGLDSAVGSVTLATLEAASGVLFTTDCGQEFTAPEMEYLKAARQRCPHVLCVMTKSDLYPHARAIVERNRAHLATAGLDDVGLFPVSSVLHLLALAQNDTNLEAESGFAALFEALHQRIWEPARREGLAEAGRQIAEVADHLAIPIEAEREALGSAAAAERVIDRLGEIRSRVVRFRSSSARWQQRLADGMQDVTTDLDHDLRTRMRQLSRLAEGRIDSDDSGDDLTFETWLHKVTMEQVVEHYESIVSRASRLADGVAEQFATFDQHAAYRVESAAPIELLAEVHINREQSLVKDGIIRRVVTTGQGYSSGMIVGSSVLGLLAPAFIWLPVITLPIAGFMARKAFIDDRARRKMARRQELKRLANRYLDEVGFVVHKDSRDTLRRLHRQIRDHYAQRAEQLEQTLQQALAAAEKARAGEQAGQEGTGGNVQAIEQSAGVVQQVRRAADRLVAVAPGT